MSCFVAVQIASVDGDVEANVARHVAAVDQLAARRPSLVLFPELSLTGYLIARAPELAPQLDDPRLAPLLEAAARHDVDLVVGAPLATDRGLALAALRVRPDGTIDVYAKRHLGAFGPSAKIDGVVPPPERSVFTPGEEDPLWTIDGRRAAPAICADTGHPDHAANARRRGADLYLASVFVIPSESGDLERGADAARLGMAVVLANFAGPSGGLASAGRSAAWAPGGERLAEAPGSGEAAVLLEARGGGWSGEVIPLRT